MQAGAAGSTSRRCATRTGTTSTTTGWWTRSASPSARAPSPRGPWAGRRPSPTGTTRSTSTSSRRSPSSAVRRRAARSARWGPWRKGRRQSPLNWCPSKRISHVFPIFHPLNCCSINGIFLLWLVPAAEYGFYSNASGWPSKPGYADSAEVLAVRSLDGPFLIWIKVLELWLYI